MPATETEVDLGLVIKTLELRGRSSENGRRGVVRINGLDIEIQMSRYYYLAILACARACSCVPAGATTYHAADGWVPLGGLPAFSPGGDSALPSKYVHRLRMGLRQFGACIETDWGQTTARGKSVRLYRLLVPPAGIHVMTAGMIDVAREDARFGAILDIIATHAREVNNERAL